MHADDVGKILFAETVQIPCAATVCRLCCLTSLAVHRICLKLLFADGAHFVLQGVDNLYQSVLHIILSVSNLNHTCVVVDVIVIEIISTV